MVSYSHTIRSFVRRNGRITSSQQRALETLWSRYGIENDNILNLKELFGREAKKHLEIGFGRGDMLLAMAKAHPEYDYLGVEVHRPGIGHLLLQLESAQLTNVRVICADVVEVLQYRLSAACLDKVYLFFPDPWPKKRHHKRRLVQPQLIALLAQRMKTGGYLHLATDWQDYAEDMLQTLETAPSFVNSITGGGFASSRLFDRPVTKFEQRGLRLGHRVWELLYQRQ